MTSEKTDDVVQEIIDIVSQKKFNAGMELLEMRFLIGEALVGSPLWAKNSRQKLLEDVTGRVGLGDRSLRYCAEFFEKFKTWDKVMDEADPDHKLPAWREIVKELPSGHRTPTATVVKDACKHCPIHCNE